MGATRGSHERAGSVSGPLPAAAVVGPLAGGAGSAVLPATPGWRMPWCRYLPITVGPPASAADGQDSGPNFLGARGSAMALPCHVLASVRWKESTEGGLCHPAGLLPERISMKATKKVWAAIVGSAALIVAVPGLASAAGGAPSGTHHSYARASGPLHVLPLAHPAHAFRTHPVQR